MDRRSSGPHHRRSPKLIAPDATTRRASTAFLPAAGSPPLLAAGEVVTSPESGIAYRVERWLGAGGFGQVFLARRLTRSRDVPRVLCLKVSTRIDGWLREAYFGQLLADHPRAIRVFDTFPLARDGKRGLYCLALEYARHGDLSAFLHRAKNGLPERTTRREIVGILQVLGRLHRGQLLHRDLTPLNVFVCDGRTLKLGDFGIVRQQSNRRGITAHTLNASMVPSDMLGGDAPKWRARDDVYQVGQLIAMLVKGDARARIRTGEVRRLACSDHLKEIVHRCIGERRKRYESADELIEALGTPPSKLKAGALRTLKGAHVAFTGILSRTRADAVKAARRAGATVHSGPSAKTTVVVRGRPNPLQVAGREGGLKLMEIKRLREKGQRITLLNDAQFWRLAGKRS
ncbi:MAG TPA: protein kinase [Vicinamibacterales bacterium]|nr:protein kinase [Vicinamibacterales bacterium]